MNNYAYTLRKFVDQLAPGAISEVSEPAQHTMILPAHGSASIDGEDLTEGVARYIEGPFALRAGSNGATIWRWGICSAGSEDGLLRGNGIASTTRMTRSVKMFEMVPTSKWLFRLDKVLNFRGTTGLHSHPGSGIRCMIRGTLRTESTKGENTYNSLPGDVWYEEGAYPLVSTVDEGDSATFVRGMILPPEYFKFPDTAAWIEGFKGSYDGSVTLQDVIVTLR